MNWTESKPPTKGVSYYDHVCCETPLGTMVVEWENWKESSYYTVELNGDIWIGSSNNIEGAKDIAINYLLNKSKELAAFFENETEL